MKKSSLRIILVLTGTVLLGLGAYLIAGSSDSLYGRMIGWIGRKIHEICYESMAGLFKSVLLSVWFWVALFVTFAAERLMPAKKNQKIFSVSFAQDVVWFFYETILHASVILTYIMVVKRVYSAHFSWMTINSLNQTAGWVRFIFALLLLDFLYWLQHFVVHKVPAFWELHKIHHSQKALNFFTDYRYHVLEYFVRETFLVIPFLIFQVSPPDIAVFTIVKSWYTRFYHGNIRADLGPLRCILVTPQSHRIHHSNQKEHFDKNFGSLFSIWDRVFKTQYMGYGEYPDTGIGDQEFPHEERGDWKSLILTPIRQMIYSLSWISKSYQLKSEDKSIPIPDVSGVSS